MKATAVSPANIAFIKYWGRLDHKLFLPLSTTNSMNLSECKAITTAEFGNYSQDEITIITSENEKKALKKEEGGKTEILFKTIDRVREISGVDKKVKVVSKLTFPYKSGVASSAAGISAFVAALYKAVGLREKYLDKEELSREVRLAGSPSAARSVMDGFTELLFGETHEESFVQKIADENHWDIYDVVLVLESGEKKISSSEGHEIASTSPFYNARIDYLQGKSDIVRKAILERDFTTLAKYAEADSINMHAIMMTSTPPAYYLSPGSMEIIRLVEKWRSEGLDLFFTFDAGANPHLIVEGKFKDALLEEVKKISFLDSIIVNKPAEGTKFDDSLHNF